MKQSRKLKPVNKAWIGLIFIGNGVLLAISFVYNFWEIYIVLLAAVILSIVLINVLFAFRTRNPAYLVMGLHYTVIAALYLAFVFHEQEITKISLFCFFFTVFWVMYLGLSRKLKWRKDELLELAAQPVDTVTNGFTTRPQPAGKVDNDKDLIQSFAKFVLKNLIAVPYIESGRAVLVITERYRKHLTNIITDYSGESYVVFNYDGNVSVNITKQDYLKYKEELSFDKLCSSMGDLFIDFFDKYKKEEESRIIDKLNELKLNPFTGGLVGF
jgi:hypothetical protein